MLQEIRPEELNVQREAALVYFYTPLCGTCAEASRMLNIALETLRPDLPALSCNMNFAPKLAKEWEIESVPCLILFRDGGVEEKIYAFHSVSFLYDFLKQKM